MIQLIILDVEGVLTPADGSEHPWPLRELLAVRAFLETAPCACVLCTGRQAPYGEAMIQALNLFRALPPGVQDCARSRGIELAAWPSIFENGAVFYDPATKITRRHPSISDESLHRLRQARWEILEPFAAATGAQIELGKEYSLSLNPPHLPSGQGERLSTAAFRPEVEAALTDFRDHLEIKHSISAIDITPRSASKASAVRLLLEWTDLAPEEVLGVGDSVADRDWLAEVGWRAAPANGRDALPGMQFYGSEDSARGLLQILEHARSHGFQGL